MILSELFDQLTYGELSDKAIGGKGDGGIKVGDYPQIVLHLNAGLKDLHTRLPMRFEEILITQYDHIQTYYLRPEFAMTNTDSVEPVKYIMDSIYQPFLDNVIKVEQVFSEDGEERPLNDPSMPYSVWTPKYNSISIPFNDPDNTFSVIYRSNHEKIVINELFQPSQVEIDIPAWIEEALLIFIAGRVIGNTLSADNLNTSSYYTNRYELAIKLVEQHNLINQEAATNRQVHRNGWV